MIMMHKQLNYFTALSNNYKIYKAYQLVRDFQLRAELIKITSFERAQNTEQEYQIFSKTYAQVPSKIFLK